MNTFIPATTDEMLEKFRAWGAERGLHDTNDPTRQVLKLGEEYGELCAAVARDDDDRIMDAVGDMIVVLAQVSAVCEIMYVREDFMRNAMRMAWQHIRYREGKTTRGVFVKDE